MIGRSFANWSSRARAIFFLLWVIVATVTCLVLSGIGETEADLDLSIERCILITPGSFELSGFSPVSECVLCRMDAVELGPGQMDLPGAEAGHLSDFSLHLKHNRSTSSVTISGRDIAIGKLSAGPGRFDMRRLAPGCMGIDFFPFEDAEESRGGLSLGDTCTLMARGYELLMDGSPAPVQPEEGRPFVFRPLGGAGRFTDGEGGFDVRAKPVDGVFGFSGQTEVSLISFIDLLGTCAGVSGGTIRIGRDEREVTVPPNACLRSDADEYDLRYLGMAPGSAELRAALSGRFRLLELNQLKLIGRPTSLGVLIGLVALVVLGLGAHAVKRVLGPLSAWQEPAQDRLDETADPAYGRNHFFISHSHQDRRYARKLAQEMREQGYLVWLDEDMRGGEGWQDEIKTRIKNCAAFILIVTAKSRESKWVDGELAHATDSGREVIPMLLEGKELPLGALGFQAVNVTHGNMPPKRFFDSLERFSPKCVSLGDRSRTERLRIEQARDRIRALGVTVYRCTACGFPVSYDSMAGAAAAALIGLPSIGGLVVYFLYGWKAAIVAAVVALGLVIGVLLACGEALREPTRCPDCGRTLTKPLGRYS